MIEFIAVFTGVYVLFGSIIYRVFFFKRQGHTHQDIYNQRKYNIKPDRANDEEQTITFKKDTQQQRGDR